MKARLSRQNGKRGFRASLERRSSMKPYSAPHQCRAWTAEKVVHEGRFDRHLRSIRERLLGLNRRSLVGTVLAEEKQAPPNRTSPAAGYSSGSDSSSLR